MMDAPVFTFHIKHSVSSQNQHGFEKIGKQVHFLVDILLEIIFLTTSHADG